MGSRRRRLRIAEGAHDAARPRPRGGLRSGVRRGRLDAALLLRLGADAQGAARARRVVHAAGLARRRARRRARPAPRRGARRRVRAACAARPCGARRREGDGPRALLAGRGQERGRDRRPVVGLGGGDQGRSRPVRHHARGRPGRPEGEDLPHRPHRLVRRLRRHHGARRHRARALRARRRHRARRRGDGGARGVRALPGGMKVLVRESIADAGVDLLRARFDVDVDLDSPLEDIVGLYDAIVVRSATKLTAEVIERATNLKVIGRAGVGVDNVDVEAATRRGIVVANAPESTVVSAAEHTIGLLVGLARNIPQAHAALKQGRWERSSYGGIELAGKTLGVLGFGRIGQQVARRALGLGMRVVAYDPYVATERFRELGAERVETPEEIYAAAEFITLHLPLTDETRRTLDATAFSEMRGGVRIVNAARGELVDEDALLDALRSGKVAGAALDVFGEEPYSGPLLELDSVVVTPHLAASTEEAQDRAGLIVAEQIVAALDGGLVTNAVNIPAIGAEDLEV